MNVRKSNSENMFNDIFLNYYYYFLIIYSLVTAAGIVFIVFRLGRQNFEQDYHKNDFFARIFLYYPLKQLK